MIDLKILQPGDIIDYRSYKITATSIQPGNIETAHIVGTTEGGALIKSTKFPGLTICVQTHNIIAARRVIGGKTVTLYPKDTWEQAKQKTREFNAKLPERLLSLTQDKDEELFYDPEAYQSDHSDSSEHLWWYPGEEEK